MYDCKIKVSNVIVNMKSRICNKILKIKYLIYRFNNKNVAIEVERNDLKQWFIFLSVIKTNPLGKWSK